MARESCHSCDFDVVMEAAQQGDRELVLQALAAGLDVNRRDFFERTLLYAACHCGHKELVRALLDEGAVDDPSEKRCSKNALSTEIAAMLEPMYDRVRQTFVAAPAAPYCAAALPSEEDDINDMLARIAISDARLGELASSLGQGWREARPRSADHLVGSLPGGRCITRAEWDSIDWGTWEERFAVWLCERKERLERYRRMTDKVGCSARSGRCSVRRVPVVPVRSAARTKVQVRRQRKLAMMSRSAPGRGARAPARSARPRRELACLNVDSEGPYADAEKAAYGAEDLWLERRSKEPYWGKVTPRALRSRSFDRGKMQRMRERARARRHTYS